MLRFRCVAISEQNCDLSTGQGERAIVELPIAVGHLQDMINLGNKRLEGKTQRFILLISLRTWWRETTNPSQHG